MNSLRKILYIGPFQLPDKNAAAQRVIGNAKLLKSIGYEIVLAGFDRDISENEWQQKEKLYGFDVISIGYPNSLKYWFKYALSVSTIEEILNQNEEWCAVIAYNFPGIVQYRLKKLCKSRKIKLIADCTEWYGNVWNFSPHQWATNIDSMIRMYWANKKVDGIIAISSYLEGIYSKKIPVVVIPPLVDIKENKWIKSEKQRREDRINLFYVGSPGKNIFKDRIDLIIRCLYESENENIHFNVIGITKKDYLSTKPDHSLIVHELESKSKLIFWGKIPHVKAIDLLSEADFSIFLRENNRTMKAGFPTKFVESITCGVPVITNNISDLSNYCDKKKNGIIISNEDMINSLDHILQTIFNYKEIVTVDNTLFDFRNYKSKMNKFFNRIF